MKRKHIRNIINEIMENQGDDYYRTTIKGAYVNSYDFEKVKFPNDERDLDVMFSDFIVVWDLDMESRSWGVKNIGTVIKTISGTILVEDFDTREVVLEETINVGPDNNEWTIENKMSIEGGSIYPTSLEINFAKKTIEVS
jgi:hypothetical protein